MISLSFRSLRHSIACAILLHAMPGTAAAQSAATPAPAHRAEPHPHAKHPPPHHAATHPATRPAPQPTPPPPATPAPAETPPAPPAPSNKGSTSGLPLPRFASLRTDDVNFRAGPGTRYPIDWVYKRRDLPVEIEREFDVWRLVRDPDNNRGWVHVATLASRRTLVVTGSEVQSLLSQPRDDAIPAARLEPGVIGRLRSCEANSDWCQVQVKEYKGWMRRDGFWGTLPGEVVQ